MLHYQNAPRNVRFTALDGWRGIIACIIALCHLNVYGHLYGISILKNAYILVDVFFVLSGFVISYSYLDRVQSAPQLVTFVGKRFSRLWPLHVVMLAAFIATEALKLFLLHGNSMPTESAPFQGNNTISSIIPNIMLIHSLGIYDDYTWNIPSWALSVEFYTYIVFGIILYTASRTRVREHLTTGMMIAVSLISLLVILRYSSRGIDTDVEYGIFRCLMDFGVGFATYRIWKYINIHVNTHTHGFYVYSLLEFGTIAAFIAFVHVAGHTPFATLSPIVAAVAILVFAYGKGMLSHVLSGAIFQKLGKYSYCIYIIHVFIVINVINRPLNIIEKITGSQITRMMSNMENQLAGQSGKLIVMFNQWQADVLTLVYLMILIALAGFAYNCVELPCARYLDRFFSRSTGSPDAVQSLPRRPAPARIS